MSPLLFNLVLEGILLQLEKVDEGYRFQGGATVRALAYADDLCIIRTSKQGINHMLSLIYRFFQWAGLSINPSKCAVLSTINRNNRKYVEPFQPTMGPDLIPALKWVDHYKYLGVQMGRQRLGSRGELEEEILRGVETISSSLLADWQKVKAANIFVLSKANYYLDAALVDQSRL